MPSSDQECARILVVDDEPSILQTLSLILRLQGYETTTAVNGALAVEAARTFRPHCVIADVRMPVMNGVEVAMRIKEILPECKVLLISGYAVAADTLKEARAKGYDFPLLSKPTPVADLLRSVAAQLASE